MDVAQRLLETTSAPIDSIRRQVGYGDPSAVRRIFKRHTGITTIQYRERYGWSSARRARSMTAPVDAAMPGTLPLVTPTVYEWAGGRKAFERWLNGFYDLVERDELLAEVFAGRVSEEHRRNVTTWWCEVMGGPAEYTAHHGGYEHMLGKHRGLEITPEQRLRFVTLLSQAADEADLPDDPEFRAAIMGYAEWGTRLALLNSKPGADVVPHAPVPHWGWGEAPPYQP